MGLFQRNFVNGMYDLANGIGQVDLNKELQFEFKSKVHEIEDYDIECIRLIKRLSRAGHIPEKHKRALLHQLVSLLRKLERLKIKNSSKLDEIRTEVETVLIEELTSERIGIELNKTIYHGTGISGIRTFNSAMDEFDYMGMRTLGSGIYCTDNRRMAVNYAFYRHARYTDRGDLRKKYGSRVKATIYTLRLKRNRNYIANLNDPRNIRAIYEDLKNFIDELSRKPKPFMPHWLHNFSRFLEGLIDGKYSYTFSGLHALLERGKESGIGQQNYNVLSFLKSIGYSGLRTMEGGEISESVYPWQESLSYLIFDPNDIEIINEEHYSLRG